MIYIDNGTTVKQYYTDKRIEKAIMILLEANEDLCHSETIDGCGVKIVDKEKGDMIFKSDALDAFGHGSTYTSEDAQRIIKGIFKCC